MSKMKKIEFFILYFVISIILDYYAQKIYVY